MTIRIKLEWVAERFVVELVSGLGPLDEQFRAWELLDEWLVRLENITWRGALHLHQRAEVTVHGEVLFGVTKVDTAAINIVDLETGDGGEARPSRGTQYHG